MIGDTMGTISPELDDRQERPDAPVTDRGFSWHRVAFAVAVAGLALFGVELGISGALTPDEHSGPGTVTLEGATYEAVVCESLERGIELHFRDRGERDRVLHVRHMGPPELYEDHAVRPPRTDGTFLVAPAADGETWSRPASQLRHPDEAFAFVAAFEDGRIVQVHYGDHGWCKGADPNVAWRVFSR